MYKIGYISGMFDVLHIGHISILKYAKSVCEHLIVAVGTDDFIRSRKKREPIMNYNDRVTIIRAIRYVDEVVPAIDLDKVAAQKKYHFDVMIAGDDHISEPIYISSEQALKRIGVDTLYFSRIPNVSSTNFRKILLEHME